MRDMFSVRINQVTAS